MPKWIHVGRYAQPGEQEQNIEQTIQEVPKHPGECEDQNESCDAWAVTGECEKNSAFMVGTAERPGACLKACSRCDILKKFREAHQPEATQASAAKSKLSRWLR